MSLSLEEKKIGRELKEQGFSNMQIAGKISSLRLGKETSAVDTLQKRNEPSTAEKTFKDIPSDFLETAGGVKTAFQTAGERIVDIGQDEDLTFGEKARGIGAESFRGASRAFGESVVGAGKAFLTPETEARIGTHVMNIGRGILEDPDIQSAIAKFQALDEDTKRELNNAAGFAEGLMELVGLGVAKRGIQAGKEVVGEGFEAVVEQGTKAINNLELPARPDIKLPTLKRGEGKGVVKDVVDDILPTFDSSRDRLIARALNLAPVEDLSRIKLATGNDVGEFLGRFDLIKNTPSETVEALAKFQQQNYNRVSDFVSLVDNKYTFKDVPAFENIVNFLEGEFKTGTSKEFKQAFNILDNIKTADTIDLAQIQQVKRMFDEITSFYNRSGEVKAAKKAADMSNNMRDVRRFIVDEVKAQYPDVDVRMLNNNVQTSREILDAIIKRSGKSDTASLFQLGDMAILGAGNITAPGAGFAALFGKKFIESSPIQLRLARKLDDMARKAVDDGVVTPAEIKAMDDLLTSELEKSLSKQEVNNIEIIRQQLQRLALPQGDLPAIIIPPVERSGAKAVQAGKGIPEQGKSGRFEKRFSSTGENLNPSLKGKGEIPETNLINEAKKFDSAEEFVEAQGDTLFRGGESLESSKMTNSGISFSKGKQVATDFAKEKNGSVVEYVLDPKAKVIEYSEIPNLKFKNLNDYSPELDTGNRQIWRDLEVEYQKAVDYAKANNYDAVKLPLEGEMRIINKDIINIKSQLEDIWKQANKTIPETNLINEAKKFDSAEEFVDNAETLFRGVSNQPRGNATLTFGDGLYLTNKQEYAKLFGDVSDFKLSSSANILDSSKPVPNNLINKLEETFGNIDKNKSFREVYDMIADTTGKTDELTKIIKDSGYDGVRFLGGKTPSSQQFPSVVLYNPEQVLTKSQLEDIWKKANSTN